MIPWWIVASLVANVSITLIEFLNRKAQCGFWEQLQTTAPLILVAQAGLFYAWKGAPSMMLAWALFASMNCLMRLLSNHFFVGEPLNWRGWLGCSIMFLGMYVVKAAK